MDSREFQSRIKTLQGSITKNEPAADILAQIETIKKDSRPNEDLLRVSLFSLLLLRPAVACCLISLFTDTGSPLPDH